MGAQTQTHVDRLVAELATKQHGVASMQQLIEIGLTRRAIARRLESGRLHQLYRGVYAVGHKRLTRRGYWMAAVLAAGDGAVLSHRSAAALWGLLPAPTTKIELTLPITRRNRQNLVLYCKQLSPDEITTHEGIPTTTPSRTIF